LEKKKDYKERAKNYHEKEDKLKLFKQKAELKNQDEFYFKMLKSKKNEDGKIEMDSDDSDFDEKEFRAALKTENYNIVKLQKSIVERVFICLKIEN
jgi:U3 small nucleolar RNA-associated protein 11